MSFLGVVLAGGQSARMGRTKAVIVVEGRPLASRSIDALRSAGAVDVVIVGGDPDELAVLDVDVVADLWAGEGPVGGVLTALAYARETGVSDTVVVLSCDLDRITAESVRRLVGESGGMVRVAATDRLEPLCAAWTVDAEAVVAERFADGERALHRVIAHLPHVTVTVDDDEMHNVNRPQDLEPGSRDESRSVTSPIVTIEEISVADLHALGPDIVLLDVREDHEWAEGRVPYARHVALGTVPENLDAFSGSPTYVMCKVGGRSMGACEYAAGLGHHVVNVAGGILAWNAAGYELATDA